MSDRRARRFFWAVLIGGLLVSIGGNDLHAVLPPDQELPWTLRAVVGAVAPVAVVVSIHGLTILMRVRQPSSAADRRAATDAQQEVAPTPTPTPTPAHSSSATVAATAADPSAPDQNPGAPVMDDDRGPVVTGPALPYLDLADKVLGIITVKDIEPQEVAEVLRMSYEHNLPNRDIGRRLTLRHHTVGKIIDASAQVLRDEPLAKVS